MSHAFGSYAPASSGDGETLGNIVLDDETAKEYVRISLNEPICHISRVAGETVDFRFRSATTTFLSAP